MTKTSRGLMMLLGGSVLAACDSAQTPETTGDAPQPTAEPTQPPADTTPPETTAAPETTTAPDSTTDETPWWVLLIVLFGLFVLFIALLVGRSRRSEPAAAPPAWKAHAQRGYAEARWLSDNMTEPLAIWHGDAVHEESAGATDESRQRTWDQLSPRLERATSELYALEAAAKPGSPALQASQATIAALNETYSAVTERSDARGASRGLSDAEEGVATSELTSARDREARASANLTAARQRLNAALTDLSAIS